MYRPENQLTFPDIPRFFNYCKILVLFKVIYTYYSYSEVNSYSTHIYIITDYTGCVMKDVNQTVSHTCIIGERSGINCVTHVSSWRHCWASQRERGCVRSDTRLETTEPKWTKHTHTHMCGIRPAEWVRGELTNDRSPSDTFTSPPSISSPVPDTGVFLLDLLILVCVGLRRDRICFLLSFSLHRVFPTQSAFVALTFFLGWLVDLAGM